MIIAIVILVFALFITVFSRPVEDAVFLYYDADFSLLDDAPTESEEADESVTELNSNPVKKPIRIAKNSSEDELDSSAEAQNIYNSSTID